MTKTELPVKKLIKQCLERAGLWHFLDLLRKTPEILTWLRFGCHGIASHPLKMIVVRSYLKRYSLSHFIETGTYLGDTLNYIARTGVQCISIELSESLYNDARRRFKAFDNVKLVQGDSGKKIPEILSDLRVPVLFWLDGHYSAGITAKAETHTPVSSELRAILDHPVKQHVILIDDARCFDGTNDYPHLDELLRVIREEGSYSVEITTDIIRLVPR